MKQIDDFEKYFEQESWELFQSFLRSLQTAMESYKVDLEKKTSILDGIYDFVDDFFDEHDCSKMDFKTTLELLNEIGSPSDVLKALDVTTIVISEQEENIDQKEVICEKCSVVNPQGAIFCEKCGTMLKYTRPTKAGIYQQIIDRPFSGSCIFFYLVFVFMKLLPLFTWFGFSTEFFLQALISPDVIIGSIICAIISGLIFDFLFKKLKSKEYKLIKLIDSLETNFALALIITFYSFIFISLKTTFYFSEILDDPIIIVLFIGGFFFSFIFVVILGLWNYSGRPSDCNYFSLLKIKQMINEYSNRHMIRLNILIIFPVAVLATIIQYAMLVLDRGYVYVPGFLFLTILGTFTILSLINGICYMYYYSWTHIRNQLSKNI